MIPFPILTTPGGEELVVVPRAEYERLAALAAEAEEDADDVRTYLEAKAGFVRSDTESYPADLTALLLEHKSRLGAIRRWRGLSLAGLAEKAGISEHDLTDFEAGRRTADAESFARMSVVLGVNGDWLN
jgi:ribosome-binding protein aMBF1 (putative translation factor)